MDNLQLIKWLLRVMPYICFPLFFITIWREINAIRYTNRLNYHTFPSICIQHRAPMYARHFRIFYPQIFQTFLLSCFYNKSNGIYVYISGGVHTRTICMYISDMCGLRFFKFLDGCTRHGALRYLETLKKFHKMA